jgi:hypothetical protein
VIHVDRAADQHGVTALELLEVGSEPVATRAVAGVLPARQASLASLEFELVEHHVGRLGASLLRAFENRTDDG